MGICHLSVFLNIYLVVSCRTSILSDVSTRSNAKLPSGKNILIFGEYYLFYICESLLLLQCLGCVWLWWSALRGVEGTAKPH